MNQRTKKIPALHTSEMSSSPSHVWGGKKVKFKSLYNVVDVSVKEIKNDLISIFLFIFSWIFAGSARSDPDSAVYSRLP